MNLIHDFNPVFSVHYRLTIITTRLQGVGWKPGRGACTANVTQMKKAKMLLDFSVISVVTQPGEWETAKATVSWGIVIWKGTGKQMYFFSKQNRFH